MDQVRQLVEYISPSPRIPGKRALILAVTYTLEAETADKDVKYFFTKDIYPLVARDLMCSRQAAEQRVMRAVNCCWMGGQNEALTQICGKQLNKKPTPAKFLLYCVFYLLHQSPFHNRTPCFDELKPQFREQNQ